MKASVETQWIDLLDEEERAFVRRFVLASGSLKELAQTYDVSYPTLRLRLDRLIEKIEVFDKFQERSEPERLLRAFYAEGKIPDKAFRSLLQSIQRSQP